MPDWIFKNKPTAYATLASPSGTSGATLTLTTGHGTRLPAPGAGQISAVRIENELITYTGNSGDVLTGVTRGAGATNHVAGTEVKNVLVEEWANAVTALSTDTKAALVGTSGTPQATNKFVTDADPRNSDARNPNSHSHVEGDTTGLVADLAARVLTTDSRLSDARTPTTHAISHKATGGDVLAGIVGGYAPLDSGLLVPVANLGTGTPTGAKFLRDDRVWAVPAGGGGGSITIEELDGTPSVAAATKLILPNGTVSVTGTEATYTPSGGGGGLTHSYVGYNTVGASNLNMGIGTVYLKKITLASAGFLASISAYVKETGDNILSIAAAVFDDTGGSAPSVQHVIGASATGIPSGGNQVWSTGSVFAQRWFHMPIGVYLPAGDYWLAVQAVAVNAGNIQIAYDTGGSDYSYIPGGVWFADGTRYTPSADSRHYSIRGDLLQ